MVTSRRKIPDIGDLVVGTISRVENHGAYAILDEYENKEGMIHISEVASSWVRNIRNFVRERQKIVAKVLAINERKGHIDLSLRRVTDEMKKEKVKQWKRAQKAENLLELSVQKYNEINGTNLTLDDAYNQIGWKMQDLFGDILAGFEEGKQKGERALSQKRLPAKWVEVLSDIAENNVEIPHIKLTGVLEIQCNQPDGVIQIQNALRSGMEFASHEDTEIYINLIGSPKYRIEVISTWQKEAEAMMDKVTQKISDTISKNNGVTKFTLDH
ncbi:MAG: translation initiation factor IF-2 subunit alpha [Promethearchaeota archaeon]|nr:MAG: translation initiation factor IF-2 subunit alpha [Candidatus Lokiarchaeota archaeon]